MVSFNSVPSNIRIPFMAVEFDSSKAQQGPSLLSYKAIAIGQKTSAGAWTANTLQRCTSVEQAIVGGGRGSMIHRQALAWFANNKITELWFGVLADDAGGVAATGTIVVAASANLAGTIALYIGGERITVSCAAGAAQNDIATAIRDAINANLDLPVTAAVNTATVTLTYRHKGLAGNALDVRHSFRDGEELPSGVTLTITAMGGVVAGTTNPALTNLIAAMADMWFQIWTHPYTDATSLTAIEGELALRFGPMRQQSGLAVTSMQGNFSAHTTLGDGRNSPHSCIIAQPSASPLTPPLEFAAAVAAQVAIAGAADPARPFQTLALQRVVGPAETDLWSAEERNLFLFDGISTSVRAAGGVVQIERLITTYQENGAGADDTAYLDATTMLTLLYLRYDFRNTIQTRYPRHKLANDGTRLGAGQPVITPKIGKAEAVLWFGRMEKLGLVENAEQFEADLVCVRSDSDPNRLEWLLPPDLINQFIVGAAKIEFRL